MTERTLIILRKKTVCVKEHFFRNVGDYKVDRHSLALVRGTGATVVGRVPTETKEGSLASTGGDQRARRARRPVGPTTPVDPGGIEETD